MKVITFCLLTVILFSGCNSKKTEPEKQTIVDAKDTSRTNNVNNKINPYAIVDISPMDITYFPVDYPLLKMEKRIDAPPLARVVYSRPHLQGRKLFQTLLKYGEPWRLGANESTELQLFASTEIQGKQITPGRYVLYCIPQVDKWTIILNTNIDSWGLHPDSTKDIARFVIPVTQTPNHLEYYTMVFEKKQGGTDLLMAWDNFEARLPFVFDERHMRLDQ